MRHIRRSQYRRTAWKNGRGSTEEIAEANDGSWRLSLATVERDGPFSDFTGFDRTLTLVDGEALILTIDGSRRRVSPGESCRFPGEANVLSVLPAGPVRVLNVMTRRGTFDHDVHTGGRQSSGLPAVLHFSFALDGPDRFDTFEGNDAPPGLSIDIVHPLAP